MSHQVVATSIMVLHRWTHSTRFLLSWLFLRWVQQQNSQQERETNERYNAWRRRLHGGLSSLVYSEQKADKTMTAVPLPTINYGGVRSHICTLHLTASRYHAVPSKQRMCVWCVARYKAAVTTISCASSHSTKYCVYCRWARLPRMAISYSQCPFSKHHAAFECRLWITAASSAIIWDMSIKSNDSAWSRRQLSALPTA